jgi:hypothetical protein
MARFPSPNSRMPSPATAARPTAPMRSIRSSPHPTTARTAARAASA